MTLVCPILDEKLSEHCFSTPIFVISLECGFRNKGQELLLFDSELKSLLSADIGKYL